jgi:hypothetical protein
MAEFAYQYNDQQVIDDSNINKFTGMLKSVGKGVALLGAAIAGGWGIFAVSAATLVGGAFAFDTIRDLMREGVGKGTKKGLRGVAETAAVLFETVAVPLVLGGVFSLPLIAALPTTISLLATGSFLSTHAGNLMDAFSNSIGLGRSAPPAPAYNMGPMTPPVMAAGMGMAPGMAPPAPAYAPQAPIAMPEPIAEFQPHMPPVVQPEPELPDNGFVSRLEAERGQQGPRQNGNFAEAVRLQQELAAMQGNGVA